MAEEKQQGWLFWRENSPEKILTANPAMLNGALGIEVLVRELIQNSRDAHDGDTIVEMVAEEGMVDTSLISELLCFDDLKKHIQGTIDLAGGNNGKNERIISKSNSQLALLSQNQLSYFKFSDYNTKGIDGIEGYDSEKAFWKLLFQEGSSDKPDLSSGGGVGVGKNATFPFSGLSTVIYVTRTSDGYGLAGNARLASSEVDGHMERMNGRLVAYSDPREDVLEKYKFESLSPLSLADVSLSEASLFDRDKKGTDVIILGTDGNAKLTSHEWPYLMAAYAIKNYFIAFLEKKIALTIRRDNGKEIRIQDNPLEVLDALSEIDGSAELGSVIEEAKILIDTYRGSEEDEDYAKISDEIDGIGPVTLYLNRSKGVNMRQWSIYRSFGMRTVSKGVKVQRPVVGVLVVEGQTGNDLLLRAEAGNHTEYDLESLGDSRPAVEKTIKQFEIWANNHVKTFGQFDPSETDIELAGLTNFISLEEDIKIGGDLGTGTKPIMKVIEEEKPKKRRKNLVRRRDSERNDQSETIDDGSKSEQWNHDPEHEHNWNHERDTRLPDDDSISGNKKSYDRTLNVSATFRDIHAPLAREIEIIGRIASASFKKVDLHIVAIDEQSRENTNLPPIISAKNLNDGANLSCVAGHILKDVPVDSDKYIHIVVTFKTPFRAMLLEYATVTKTIVIKTPEAHHEIPDDSEENEGESTDESTK